MAKADDDNGAASEFSSRPMASVTEGHSVELRRETGSEA